MLQQHLPFTVLKLKLNTILINSSFQLLVATALTVYGIETMFKRRELGRDINTVATALTVYGIETSIASIMLSHFAVATALTVYGIETGIRRSM